MKKGKPTLIKFLKSNGNSFEIKFPKFKTSLMVSRYYYEKMVNSPEEFKFI